MPDRFAGLPFVHCDHGAEARPRRRSGRLRRRPAGTELVQTPPQRHAAARGSHRQQLAQQALEPAHRPGVATDPAALCAHSRPLVAGGGHG